MQTNDIHLWTIDLKIDTEKEIEQFAVLSADERMRAERFHFPLHRQRFIAARFALRQILSSYLTLRPEELVFAYTPHHKPFLQYPPDSSLQFNLAHSHDVAICACTKTYAIGVDIEKIDIRYNPGIAKRYFSEQENAQLMQLPEDEKNAAFFRLWSRKEALTKAVGKGFHIPLDSFTVSLQAIPEEIALEETTWSLTSLALSDEYVTALATNQPIQSITYLNFADNLPK